MSVLVPVYKKCRKTDRNDYHGISKTNSVVIRPQPTDGRRLSAKLVLTFQYVRVSHGQRNGFPWLLISVFSRLSPYIDEIVEDYQCGLRHKKLQVICFSAFVRYRIKDGSTMGQHISYSWTSRKSLIQ
jgi:hypothetical protein